METIVDLLKIVLPVGLVSYGGYVLVKSFLDKQLETMRLEQRKDLLKDTLPLRLQAYERVMIFLERITPNNLIVRLNDNSYNVFQLQNVLVREIREEYNHNMSQQVYMSDEAWNFVRKSMEEIIALINNSANDLDKEAPSIELAKKIFENVLQTDEDINGMALRFVKSEVRQLYQ